MLPRAMADTTRRVRLFRDGLDQAVTIPRDMELPGNEAMVTKEGDRLIVEAIKASSLLELLATLEPIEEEIGPIDDHPPEPVEL
jgi:antitoxin VapB